MAMSTEEKRLTYKLLNLEELSKEQTKRMFFLLQENYNSVNPKIFKEELYKKDFILIFADQEQQIQGFTSIAINPAQTGTKKYNIIFSGDTVISPDFWGTRELVKAWIYSLGRIVATDPHKKYYWNLNSKGHRTYLLLPIFCRTYYPGLGNRNAPELFKILDRVSTLLYPDIWNPTKGIIDYPFSQGELKPELAAASYKKIKNKHIEFYLQKNTGFIKGQELACLTEMCLENMIGFPKKHFSEGLKNPIK